MPSANALCDRYGMDRESLKCWYDGYSFEEAPSIYNPRSVVSCMRFGKIGNYWNQTAPVNMESFSNDMVTFRTEDDVLTFLIHLGYLGYSYANKTVFIPNNEVRAIWQGCGDWEAGR